MRALLKKTLTELEKKALMLKMIGNQILGINIFILSSWAAFRKTNYIGGKIHENFFLTQSFFPKEMKMYQGNDILKVICFMKFFSCLVENEYLKFGDFTISECHHHDDH